MRDRELVVICLIGVSMVTRVYYAAMPTYYDITVPLFNDLPTYPGDPGIEIENWRSLAKGDSANVSVVSFGAHSGTHVDAPAHFIPGGEVVENLPFESLIGEALVVQVPDDVIRHLHDQRFADRRFERQVRDDFAARYEMRRSVDVRAGMSAEARDRNVCAIALRQAAPVADLNSRVTGIRRQVVR